MFDTTFFGDEIHPRSLNAGPMTARGMVSETPPSELYSNTVSLKLDGVTTGRRRLIQ